MWVPKVEDKHFFCHQCNNELEFEVKMQRTDTCPHCAFDLNVCKNCEFWDPGAHNQCRENIAEYVTDRERANHCTHFKFRDGEAEAADKSSAMSKLEAVFGKKD